MSDHDLGSLSIDRQKKSARQSGGKRKLFYAIGAGLVLLAALFAYRFLFTVVTVETVAVSRMFPSQGFTLLNASGYVVAQRKAAVAPKTTGQLEWIGVEEGSRVSSGQLMARLENRDVTAARENALAGVAAAKANLEQAKADLIDAERSYERISGLVASGVMARADLDSAEARLLRSRGAVSAMQSAIRGADAGVAAAEAALEYTLIRAPFDAVVLTKNADIGDIVTPIGAAANAKAAVVTIADLASVQVEADISESNLSRVKIGQPCEIQLDAVPERRYRGVLHMIVPTADRSKASVLVKVRFIDRDDRILPEMSAKVAFLEREVSRTEQEAKITVPADAVAERSGGKAVFVVENGTAREKPVTLEGRLGEFVTVSSGVQAGEIIVRKPLGSLKSGARVKTAVPQ